MPTPLHLIAEFAVLFDSEWQDQKQWRNYFTVHVGFATLSNWPEQQHKQYRKHTDNMFVLYVSLAGMGMTTRNANSTLHYMWLYCVYPVGMRKITSSAEITLHVALPGMYV